MVAALIAVSVLLAVAIALGVWLAVERRHLRDERVRLNNELGQAERQAAGYVGEIKSLTAEIGDARSENARLEEKVASFDKRLAERETDFNQRLIEQRQHHEAAQQKARESFEAVANQVLDKSTERFLNLATEKFAGTQKDAAAQLEQRKQAIEALVKPIRDQLEQHVKAVAEIEKTREGAYHGLRQQITSLLDAQSQLGRQTTTLANALRSSSTARGRWGELTLKRIAEMAGMVANCDFSEQTTLWKGDAAQRPDMIVNLPSDRQVIVDAKSVGQNYLAAIEATDDDTRRRCFQSHLRDIEGRVRDLSSKSYADQLARTPDFVVLFIPGESFLAPAVELNPDLIQSAIARNVVIATPTILFSLLRVIELGWREEKIAENARRIRDIGVELHERLAKLTGDVSSLGTHLGRAIKAYNEFVGSYESRVLVSARRFKELGADSAKELPAEGEVKQVELQPRTVEQPSEV